MNEEDSALDTVFSPAFSSSPRSAMYQAWVFPELHKEERQPVLRNWSDEDLEAFCGIYKRKELNE